MENIKVFTSKFINQLGQRLRNNEVINEYINGVSPVFSDGDVKDTIIKIDKLPELDVRLSLFENSRIFYESLRDMDRTLASDQRLWVWLTHVPYMGYMSKLWPVGDQEKEKRPQYIAQHWFTESQTGRGYLRNSIAILWWGSHMTYDGDRQDPFELTQVFFNFYQMQPSFFASSLCRSDLFIHNFLDFLLNNSEYFKTEKQEKFRDLIRKLNFIGAYKNIPSLDKKDLQNLLSELIL